MRVLGLMSGTSLDGIDAALCEIEAEGDHLRAQILAFECIPYSPPLRERLLRAAQNEGDVREVARLNVEVGRAFGRVAREFFERFGRAELIGSHSQTICHLPDEGVSLQIGEAAQIAEIAGCDVVSDFRQNDLAGGGFGAPLVPYVDWILFRSPTKNRVLLNIGGISNCSILAANCALEDVLAWDCGPGNMLMDEAARHFFDLNCDRDGVLAASGSWNEATVSHAMEHPFFARCPPKTAGREEFGREFFRDFAAQNPGYDGATILANLNRFSARAIARSIIDFSGFGDDCELIVSGGGAQNPTLMQNLRDEMPRATLLSPQDFGVSPDAKEALAFAILAFETAREVPTNVPRATGAKKRAILGKMTRFYSGE